MKISVLNLGCKVNQAEMADVEGYLSGIGHQLVSLEEKPEFCIINTCSVTARSDQQSGQIIRRAARAGARVIVTGCYSELNRNEVARMEGVEGIIGNGEKHNIISEISKYISSKTSNSANGFHRPPGMRTRRFLKVQDGCNNSCSYCIIPKARGRSKSSSRESVVLSVKKAVSDGFNEVVLTGIHLGQYGYDNKSSLTGLVSDILEKTTISRLRLSSLEISEIDDGLLDIFKSGRLCRHLHIPLQSGDGDILSMMKRGYDPESFSFKIMEISQRIEGVSIGTDVIVGFPREGEMEFKNTLNLLKELPFSYVHVFPYSKRPGTEASAIADTATNLQKKSRVSDLRWLSAEKKRAFSLSNVGRTLKVLLESPSDGGIWTGTSDNYLKVRVSGAGLTRGTIAAVRVMGMEDDELVGASVSVT